MSTVVKPTYEAVAGWERIPAGYTHPDVAAVAVDSRDRVFLFCRSDHPVMIYERDGRFVGSWGEGMFTMRTHGITIGPDDSVYCTDDAGHSVRKFTPDGKLLLTLGDNGGKPSDTGYDGSTITTVTRSAPPFNRPTNLAVAPNGDLFVSDGYGNARVHRFSATGKLLASWGEPGTGPGQFMLPHGIAVGATGNVLVCDRESDRIQIFTPEGRFVREITEVQRPGVEDQCGPREPSPSWMYRFPVGHANPRSRHEQSHVPGCLDGLWADRARRHRPQQHDDHQSHATGRSPLPVDRRSRSGEQVARLSTHPVAARVCPRQPGLPRRDLPSPDVRKLGVSRRARRRGETRLGPDAGSLDAVREPSALNGTPESSKGKLAVAAGLEPATTVRSLSSKSEERVFCGLRSLRAIE